jgi:hypothetical protein
VQPPVVALHLAQRQLRISNAGFATISLSLTASFSRSTRSS